MTQGYGRALAAIALPAASPKGPLGERFAATPRLACEALARAVNEADLEGALGCFAPDACLIGPDGAAAHGEGAIRKRLSGLISRGARLKIELFGVFATADLALAHERWAIECEGGPRPPEVPSPTLVLRCLAGEWRLAIAAPWGMPASKPLRAISA